MEEPNSETLAGRVKREGGREGKPDPGLFLYNNAGEEGQADRTVISL